ncbi:MAG TPA: hypothetical protein VM581_02250 [Magnetospirillaceae bacterium]|nr:hypothetical protein [Magnetospirillaceae bacterium]
MWSFQRLRSTCPQQPLHAAQADPVLLRQLPFRRAGLELGRQLPDGNLVQPIPKPHFRPTRPAELTLIRPVLGGLAMIFTARSRSSKMSERPE